MSQLVHEAPYIAKGKISIKNDKVILNIEKMLKGESYSELLISFRQDSEAPDPIFNDGEEVILFLHIPDFSKGYIIPGLGPIPLPEIKEGEMYLFGLGDQGKWPRKYYEKYKFQEHYPKLQDTASLEAIQDVVEKLQKIEDSNNLDEKISFYMEYIKSSDKVLQYTAMEYALYGGIWTSQKENLNWVGNSTKYKYILKKLCDEIFSLSLIDDKEPTIRSEAIRLLRFAEPYNIIPLLIPKITDADRLVRSVTCGNLTQFAREQKIKGDFINFKPEDSIESLMAIQKQWNDWWEENKHRFSAKKE
ncbi:MAG: hypothetical protein JW787_09715 [Sedimentisphaerales bacterium]|nr:hypothetical protein [Sedimentisphaerales bacterium]